MSKIGRLNLEAQEEVNALGYSSVQEAIADGWDSAEWFAAREQGKAHEAWLNEKEQVLGGLWQMLLSMSAAGKSDSTEFGIVKRAHEFIQKGEV